MFKALWPCLMNSHDLCCFGSLVLFASVQPRLGPSFHASLWWDWPRLVPSTCRTSISDLETGKGPTVHQCPSGTFLVMQDSRMADGHLHQSTCLREPSEPNSSGIVMHLYVTYLYVQYSWNSHVFRCCFSFQELPPNHHSWFASSELPGLILRLTLLAKWWMFWPGLHFKFWQF